MFYSMYLASVCQRRQWPDPLYETVPARQGFYCKVRVNNREYCTDVPYETEALARDGAAMKAYMICRNFSVNDGMFPGQRPGQRSSNGVIQGLPVAIGTGRRSNRSSGGSYDTSSSSNDGTSSGGDSPKSIESSFDPTMAVQAAMLPAAQPGLPLPTLQRQAPAGTEYMCYCRRGAVRHYGRCAWCLRENGWA